MNIKIPIKGVSFLGAVRSARLQRAEGDIAALCRVWGFGRFHQICRQVCILPPVEGDLEVLQMQTVTIHILWAEVCLC